MSPQTISLVLISTYFIYNVKALSESGSLNIKWNIGKFSSLLTNASFDNSVTFHMQSTENPDSYRQLYVHGTYIDGINDKIQWNCIAIIIHGWLNLKAYILQMQRKLWIEKYGCVAISVDWSTALSLNYAYSVNSIPYVGKQVGKFLDLLVNITNVPLQEIHIVGHSLGAHVAGFSARSMKTGKPGYIHALDPAGPLFNMKKPKYRLNANDARYVECIMTNIGELGIKEPICQANFVVNNGRTQPRCPIEFACSHFFAVVIHYEALRLNNFYSARCQNFRDALNMNCSKKLTLPRMGDLSNYKKNIRGIYSVSTLDAAIYYKNIMKSYDF